VRKVLRLAKANESTRFGRDNKALIEALLTPTTLYGQLVKNLLQAKVPLHGMAHITGGGLPENLPRCFSTGLLAVVDPKSWIRPELFQWLQDVGQIPEHDLWHTFNLGVGFCLVVAEEAVNDALQICSDQALQAWPMGRIETSPTAKSERLKGLPI
jgi:phosphoribosylformylglycinamidine cyclo-ligase